MLRRLQSELLLISSCKQGYCHPGYTSRGRLLCSWKGKDHDESWSLWRRVGTAIAAMRGEKVTRRRIKRSYSVKQRYRKNGGLRPATSCRFILVRVKRFHARPGHFVLAGHLLLEASSNRCTGRVWRSSKAAIFPRVGFFKNFLSLLQRSSRYSCYLGEN